MKILGPCAVVVALAAGACGRPTYSMTDDVDLTWDFALTPRRFDDNLHAPYVRGAAVTVYASSSDEGEDLHGWSIESSDPAVFRIDGEVGTAGRDLAVRGQAVGEGTARLVLRDPRGHEVGSGTAEVRVPDAAELDAHGSLILGRDDEARVNEARVLEGGEATYLVRYFRGGRELHGSGVLSMDAPASLATGQARTTFLFEDREWLTLDAAAAAGTGAVQLFADGAAVATVPLVVVPESAIADVVVLTEPERGHADGDWLAALAQAYDADGRRIFGVDYAWNVDGAAQTADGDLYRYRFQAGQYEMVRAQRGAHADEVMIQSEDGFVDSTNRVGCAAGGGGGSVWVGLAGLGLACGRRRRGAGPRG